MLVQFVRRACMWAGVLAEMEVFNLFSGPVRQEGLSRLERAQQRQSLVSDLLDWIAIPPQAVAQAEVARYLRVRGGGPRGGGVLLRAEYCTNVKLSLAVLPDISQTPKRELWTPGQTYSPKSILTKPEAPIRLTTGLRLEPWVPLRGSWWNSVRYGE